MLYKLVHLYNYRTVCLELLLTVLIEHNLEPVILSTFIKLPIGNLIKVERITGRKFENMRIE